MSIQSTSFNALSTQRTFFNPSIDSGVNAGGVFDGRGNDFLDPDDILRNVNGFSNSVTPSNSGNAMTQLVGLNPIAQNSNSSDVLGSTNGTLNTIFSPGFGSNLLTPSPALNRDLANFNPLIWENPNSLNVQFGIMDAANKIFGGKGLFQPNLVPPLYPYLTTSIPFNNFVAPVAQQAQMFPQTFLSGSPLFQPVGGTGSITQTGLASLQIQTRIQVIQQDITSLEAKRAQVLKMDQTGKEDLARVQALAAQLQAQIDTKKAELQSLRQALLQLQAQNSGIGNGGVFPGQNGNPPYVISGNTTIFPYQNQVALMGQLLNGGNAVVIPAPVSNGPAVYTANVNGMPVHQLFPANGVPAWLG